MYYNFASTLIETKQFKKVGTYIFILSTYVQYTYTEK